MSKLQITTQQLDTVKELTLRTLVEPFDLYVYGSRTNGEARSYSDLNLIFKANNKIDFGEICKLKDAFEFSDLPFRVDIQDWYGMSESFKENINDSLVKVA